MGILNNLDSIIENILLGLGLWGPILACLLILIESILPIMPLAVFITLNFISFGHVLGFFISVVFTVLGCMLSFYIFRKGLYNWFYKKIENKTKIENLMLRFSNISFGALVTILAMPFTPAFLVNIAAGLSKMSAKKYVYALILGKAALVYFWGYVGTSLVQSLKEPIILLRIAFIMIVAYVISKFVNKVLKLD